MQNTEIDDIFNKKVRFVLFDRNGKEFTQSLQEPGTYYVLWYDAKMKNYLLFLEYLHKKKFI